MNSLGLNVTFELVNKEIPCHFSVVEFVLDEKLNTLFSLTLSLVSKDSTIDINSLILQKGRVKVYHFERLTRCINGVISSFSKGKTGFHRTFYTIVIRPSLWLLTQRHLSRLFKYQSIPEILEQLMNEYQIRFERLLYDEHEKHEMIMQRREFDYDLFSRLAALEGLIYWFECDDDGNEIFYYSDSYLGYKRSSHLTLIYNENVQTQRQENTIHDLILTANMTPQTYTGKDRLYEHPSLNHFHKIQHQTVDANGEFFTFNDGNPRLPTPIAAETMVKYRLEALQNEAIQGQAKSNYICIQPGKGIRIVEHPDPQINQRWQVISVKHRVQLPQSLEEDSSTSGAAFILNEINFMPDDVTWRPEYRPQPTSEGAETAKVVGPAGEEIFTNELGEVQVEFNWDLTAQPEKRMTRWVRVAQNWSGSHFGFYAVPRIGQEVIIDYLDGDLNRPIVIGSVYNGDDYLPLDLPAQKTQTVIKTKTYKGKGFNELRFEDATDNEEISVRAQKDMTTFVGHDQTLDVGHDRDKQIGQDQRVIIGQDDQLEVKRDQTTLIGQDYTLEIVQDRLVQVGRHEKLEIMDRAHHLIHANFNLDVKGDYLQKIEGNQHITAGNSTLVHTKKLTLNGSDNVVIQGPAGKIEIDRSGITLTASIIRLNGQIQVLASAIGQLKALESAAEKGTPLVEICKLCGY